MKSFTLIFISLAVAAVVLQHVKGVPTDGKSADLLTQCCCCGWCLSCPLGENEGRPSVISRATGSLSLVEAIEKDQSVSIVPQKYQAQNATVQTQCCCCGYCISC